MRELLYWYIQKKTSLHSNITTCRVVMLLCNIWSFSLIKLWLIQWTSDKRPCCYHLHSSHRFLSIWGAVMLEKKNSDKRPGCWRAIIISPHRIRCSIVSNSVCINKLISHTCLVDTTLHSYIVTTCLSWFLNEVCTQELNRLSKEYMDGIDILIC